MNMISDRLTALRAWMQRKGYSAYIVPSTDPHMSEYVASHWESRKWISGFSGSAGIVVVTLEKAGLWTDSRYFSQAEIQLNGTEIVLFRDGLPGVPNFIEWLVRVLKKGDKVGADGFLFSINDANRIRTFLCNHGLLIDFSEEPFCEIWSDRPTIPLNNVYIYDMEYAGLSVSDKIDMVRHKLCEEGYDYVFISALDEIAWLLNLRGSDVEYNPVFVSYLLVGRERTVLYVDNRKLDSTVRAYLSEHKVEVVDYDSVCTAGECVGSKKVIVDPAKNSVRIESVLRGADVEYGPSYISMMKAIRNDTEQRGLHNAMIKDGVALVKFLMWLEQHIDDEDEYSVGEHLKDFRASQPLFVGESFSTIAGYASNGAIVHYSATKESAKKLERKGFLLLDSGAQYLDGTTDITRTIPLGEVTDEERLDYSLVLKGNIDLAMAHFPKGTRGTQLDVLARIPLWKNGMNYLHGTGHGVGHFLNVHEGPQAIRMNDVPVSLEAGMVTSDEPGVYKPGSHGVRIENLLLVRTDSNTDFLFFEPVTLCPIDTSILVLDIFTKDEIEWLNNYHHNVYDKLSSYLNEEQVKWLKEKTKEI